MPCIVGPSSTAPGSAFNVLTSLNSLSDCYAFGNGPGIENAAEVGQAAGWPVVFCRSATTTASVMSSLYKQHATGAGPAAPAYGTIILPGADNKGSVMFQSIVPGVTFTSAHGMSAALTASGLDVTLTTVSATTTALQVTALSLTAVAALIAVPVLAGDNVNDGSSVCDTVLSKTSFDNGLVNYTPNVAQALIVAGSNSDGGLCFMSDLTGVRAAVLVGGNNTALSVYVDPTKPSVVNVVSATDGGGAATTTAAQAVVAVKASAAAMALLNGGAGILYTGAGTGTLVAAAAAPLVAVNVRQVAPATDTAGLAVTTPTGAAQVSVALATDSHGRDTTTAAGIVTAVAANAVAAALLTPAAGGSGAGIAGPAAYAALSWGGASTLTLAGTPVDGFYAFGVRIVRGGALGAVPAPTLQWAADGLNWSTETVIPGTGVVVLGDSLLVSGLTATLTGALVAGEQWYGASTAPETGSSDLQASVTACLADTTHQFGFISTPCAVSRATMVALDALLQAALQTRFIAGLWGSRDIGEGVPGETEAQWQAAVIADVQGFYSPKGLSSYGADPVTVTSPLTRRQYLRAGAYAAAARKASVPMHENLGRRKTGTLHNVVAIRHDESKVPGFATQRVRSLMTYPSKPGSFYLWGAPTMADPVADSSYTLTEYVAVALSAARAAHDTAENELNDSLPAVNAAEAGGVPVGALTQQAASDIQSKVETAVSGLIMRVKADGKASASGPGFDSNGRPLTAFTQVLRTNNYIGTRAIYVTVNVLPLGLTQTINDTIQVQIPQ